jgi:hypothetical protein
MPEITMSPKKALGEFFKGKDVEIRRDREKEAVLRGRDKKQKR